MSLLQAIVFGIVQGLTEFLPISSTAHLILLPWFLNWTDPGLAFDVAIHLGTLIALLWYFRSDWFTLARSCFKRSPDTRLPWLIIGATIPGAVSGVLAEDFVEARFRSPLIISGTLIGLALLLVIAERRGRRRKTIDELTWTDALTIGFAQALALVPGVSRSGITITAALLRDVQREAAARFSFFLSTPIIGGAVLKESYDILKMDLTADQWTGIAAGIVTSGIVGYVSIAFLLRYLQRNSLYIFVWYRVALGVVILLAFIFGFR